MFACCFAVVNVSAVAAAQDRQANGAVGTVDETVTVAQVVDGDTLRLRDGCSVHLMGINTPEIGRRGKPSEPMAEAAQLDCYRAEGVTVRIACKNLEWFADGQLQSLRGKISLCVAGYRLTKNSG